MGRKKSAKPASDHRVAAPLDDKRSATPADDAKSGASVGVRRRSPLSNLQKNVAGLIAAATIAAGAFGLGRATAPEPVEPLTPIRAGGGFVFINPLLECEDFKPSRLTSVQSLRSGVRAFVDKVIADRAASHVSVYFRDLNAGPWVGINEKEKFTPASLLKVPIMITALKQAAKDPSFLGKMLVFQRDPNPETVANFVEGRPLEPGRAYSLDDLIVQMIAASDNDAKEVVLRAIDLKMFGEVLKDIGVDVREVGNENYISVKDYASLFRLLYNATYLDRSMSEKALAILSKTTFNRGLAAPLPKTLPIAHKFGERVFHGSGLKQLHDCGIVYHERSPYLLCVMTRGDSFDRLAEVIAGVSRIVYEEVSQSRWRAAEAANPG